MNDPRHCPARCSALALFATRCRRQARRAAALGFFVLWITVVPAALFGGQSRENAADAHENVLVVRVTSDNKPVAGAHVAALHLDEHATALTDGDGLARVPLPAGGKINWLVALHAKLGIGGHSFGFPTKPPIAGGPFPIALAPPGTHTVRVVDPDGKPVPNVRCAVDYVSWPKNGVPTRQLEAARFETDEHGEARIIWMPRDVRRVLARIVDERWRMDSSDTANGISTVHVRRLEPVNGRLEMPAGIPAEGLTISANGLGQTMYQHEPTARVRPDGSFTIFLAAGDAYSVQLTDSKWTSDAWTGTLSRDSAPPAIHLVASPATPLSVHVTRGPRHEPVADAWINLRGVHRVSWKDARGQSMLMELGIRTGLYTDATGTARFFVGKGQHSVFMARDKWHEERTITVDSSKPVVVAFDRPWTEKRTVTGRLVQNHKPHSASQGTIVRAWGMARGSIPSSQGVVAATVLADGRFTVELDATDVGLYAVNPQARLAAFGRVGPGDATIDLQLVPMGSYRGAVVDEFGKALARHGVQLIYDGADIQTSQIVIQSADCDERGRFELDPVPAEASLQVLAGTPASARGTAFSVRSDRFQIDGDLSFYLDAGERRENVRLVASQRTADGSRRARPREPVEAHLKRRIRDARLAGMRLLVILRGDASKAVADFTALLRNSDEPEMLRYLPLFFEADEIETASGFFSTLGWERPKSGEVVLVAVDGTGATLGSRRIAVAGIGTAQALPAQFIKRHAPAVPDARARLEAAQREARETGRRLLFVEGGPRCDPCRELARWMEDQHALLSKDFVILKVLDNDDHAGEVIKKFRPRDEGGIPWFAIADPDGTVLATSDGPMGNIGMPFSIEAKRHFKKLLDHTARRLTPAERQKLLDSIPGESRSI